PAISLMWMGWLTAAVIGVNYLTIGKSQLRTSASTVRLRAGWPARTATTVLVITGVISAGTWLTPRMVPNEVLSEAHSEAQQERTVAAALADTDAQHTTDDNQQRDSDATLTQLTGNSAVAGVQQQALPATAIDSAQSAMQTRTLVITRTSEG